MGPHSLYKEMGLEIAKIRNSAHPTDQKYSLNIDQGFLKIRQLYRYVYSEDQRRQMEG